MINGLHWFLLLLSLALSSLYVSWQALATVDYGYAAWYDLLHINKTIETEGPRNHIRPWFQATSRTERERLFRGIAVAVNNNGKGLEKLVYHNRTGRALGLLLTAEEITHLDDVARLVAGFRIVGWSSAGLFLMLSIAALLRRLQLPQPRRIAIGLFIVLTSVALSLSLLGPVKVFYALHKMIFPAGHKWFFYYNESLMSMMMQAPNLFGPIALLLVIVALILAAIAWRLLTAGLRSNDGIRLPLLRSPLKQRMS